MIIHPLPYPAVPYPIKPGPALSRRIQPSQTTQKKYNTKGEIWQVNAIELIDQLNLADSTKQKYKRAVEKYLIFGDVLDEDALYQYSCTLGSSESAFLKAAIHHITGNKACVDAVKIQLPKNKRLHVWLSQQEVKMLLDTCDDSLIGRRDRLALRLLVESGLRRQEAVNLTFDDIKLQAINGKMRTILGIHGKGGRAWFVPVSNALANAIDDWGAAVGGLGRILRSFDQRGELRESLSGVGLYHIVRRHGMQINKLNLQPHDLRRTFIQLSYRSGENLDDIAQWIGHKSKTGLAIYL